MQDVRIHKLLSSGRKLDGSGAIVVEDLAKRYADGTEAVRGISFEVRSGEVFGILGPNGAGKSTTMGMLGTLVRPTAGRATVAGYDVVEHPGEVRRRIGFAMQEAGVDELATATELLVRRRQAPARLPDRQLLRVPRARGRADDHRAGIANAAVGLASDFQSRYLQKLLTMPVSIGSIMAGRLIADGARLFVMGGAVLLLAVALGAQVATGLAGALLMLLIGTLFAIVTFGVLTANLALKTKDPAAVQAVFPMAFMLIFLTTAYQTEEQVPSGVLRAVIGANPTEYVLQAMRELMLTGYDWNAIGLAFLVIAGLGAVGLPLTLRNYRSIIQ